MEREVTHSCGHVARHIVGGTFAAEGDAQARRLARMKCKAYFRAGKQAKADVQANADRATLAGMELPDLAGSEKQTGWATTIRLERLAALHRIMPALVATYVSIADAKWWIDHRSRDLSILSTPEQAAA